MCLAIWKPGGKEVPERYLEEAFRINSDGCGFAAATDGGIMLQKGFFNYKKFLKAYRRFSKLPCLIHFRIATHGLTDLTNCHPFLFNEASFAAVHNGIINIKCSDIKRSDTWHFVKLVLEPLSKVMDIRHPALRYLVESTISYSKIAVMDASGDVMIFNEDKGNWKDGVWYSNRTYLPIAEYTTYYQEHSEWGRASACAGVAGSCEPGFSGGVMTSSEARRERLKKNRTSKSYPAKVDAEVERYINDGNRAIPGKYRQPRLIVENGNLKETAPETSSTATGSGPKLDAPPVIETSETQDSEFESVPIMMEYGERDDAIEADIETAMQAFKCSRVDAIAALRLNLEDHSDANEI